mmetsp:Transcript_23944/g.26567  ORF Transcript_23944/g.26567 Transcript_23944/m.26567 type:complete len:99 (-) Transcript_23944:100-396(-)
MVCEKCEKKLARVICQDPWKDGARNTVESGGKKVGKIRTTSTRRSKRRASPYSKVCRICHAKLHVTGNYCNDCAYKKGICTMCGRKILDTKMYKQSLV